MFAKKITLLALLTVNFFVSVNAQNDPKAKAISNIYRVRFVDEPTELNYVSPMARANSFQGGALASEQVSTPKVNDQKIGRNDPCFCGSGEKYKKCHGKA